MSEEESGSTAHDYSSRASGEDSGPRAPVEDTLSLTDLIDRLDRAAFLASLEHRRGWKSPDPPALPASYEDY